VGTRGFEWLNVVFTAYAAGKRRSARTAGTGAARQIDRQIGDEWDGLTLHGQHRDAPEDRASNPFRDVGSA
jgi:hypothetical protein